MKLNESIFKRRIFSEIALFTHSIYIYFTQITYQINLWIETQRPKECRVCLFVRCFEHYTQWQMQIHQYNLIHHCVIYLKIVSSVSLLRHL